jgi:hypothetical protein
MDGWMDRWIYGIEELNGSKFQKMTDDRNDCCDSDVTRILTLESQNSSDVTK